MGIVIALFGFLALNSTEQAQQFAKHGNGNPVYDIVSPRSCESGLRSTGYSWSVGGGIALKQQNLDGTVGDVCEE